jgi:hypothetical protein
MEPMPRKQQLEKQTITVVVKGAPIVVILHPPSGTRRSWYASWSGLVASKSTGHGNLQDAIVAAETMVRNWEEGGTGERPTLVDAVLTDEEFEQIQRVHYGKKQDSAAKVRAAKSFLNCMDAIRAFREISGLTPITAATADDCAAFQRKALTLRKNWRQQYPKSNKESKMVSPNTVLKWSRALNAAFERANKSAGRKCVRGVVPESKLLTQNPWNQFPRIEGSERPLRQFDGEELLSLLAYFESDWPGVTVAPSLAKVALWSSARKEEITSLPPEVARRYGHEEGKPVDLEAQLRAAIAARDWQRATELSGKLAGEKRTPTG